MKNILKQIETLAKLRECEFLKDEPDCDLIVKISNKIYKLIDAITVDTTVEINFRELINCRNIFIKNCDIYDEYTTTIKKLLYYSIPFSAAERIYQTEVIA